MSKKINVTNETATRTFNLKEAMESHPNVSLRKLANACEVSYGWVLKQSNKPIAGVAYDPDAVNCGAVQDTFEKKGIRLEDLVAVKADGYENFCTMPKELEIP